jgi:glutamyl-Q tRNA(Asp) synthetase
VLALTLILSPREKGIYPLSLGERVRVRERRARKSSSSLFYANQMDSTFNANYRGRFAPSPTGPLHFGSLIAAVGSYLQAKSHGGKWLVRIEDLDTPRNVPGAADDILRTLEDFGFEWEGDVVYQSRRDEIYRAALNQLETQGATFPCACSRKEIADSSMLGVEGPIYPGTCRGGLTAGREARAIRVHVGESKIKFTDLIQQFITQNLATEIGDFVLRRADGIIAYQLAVVVDDAAQGITEIIRGADLLTSTPRQIFLQRLLGLATPQYGHLPVATNRAGEKLSKQTLAQPIDAKNSTRLLFDALTFLGQTPPSELKQSSQKPLWDWAFRHWSLAKVPAARAIYQDTDRANATISP